MERRDYDGANAGDRFNDDTGNFSGSPARDATFNTTVGRRPTTNDVAAADFGTVATGAAVFGSDLDQIGTVKEVRGDAFLVDRSMQRDVWVPAVAVKSISDVGVVLDVASGDVDDQDWENPPVVGDTDDEQSGYRDIV
jgi:hypothetical protein